MSITDEEPERRTTRRERRQNTRLIVLGVSVALALIGKLVTGK